MTFGWQPLCSVFVLGLLLGNGSLVKAAAALLADWLLLRWFYLQTGDQFFTPALVAVDAVAAAIILAAASTRWEALIVGTFAIEMTAHAAFAIGSHGAMAQYQYWWTLNDLAWVQAALCLAWGGVDVGGKLKRLMLDRGLHRRSFRLLAGGQSRHPLARKARKGARG